MSDSLQAKPGGNPPPPANPPVPPPAAEAVRAHVWVRGRVQGVGFRISTQYEAQVRKLPGWVRNLEDDRVECVFEGPKPVVEAMLAWCRRGPPGARIEDVRVEWEAPKAEDKVFRIRHSI